MKVTKLNSSQLVMLKINKYLIDWDTSSCSKPQTKIKQLLKPYWKNKIVLEEPLIPGSLLRIDFLCVSSRTIIEVSPNSTHNEFNPFFHNNSRAKYVHRIKSDLSKINWIERNDFKYIELGDEDIEKFSRDYILKKFNIDIL